MAASPSILVADDNALIRKVYSLMLDRAGYEVITAADGGETLAQIAETRPDLLVLDYMMPCMSGIEVLNQMVCDPKMASIPVLVISAVVQEMDLADEPVVQKMTVSMLTKPVAHQQLLDQVAQMLGSVQTSQQSYTSLD